MDIVTRALNVYAKKDGRECTAINHLVLVANTVGVSCLACVPATPAGVGQTVPFVSQETIVIMVGVLISRLNANVTANMREDPVRNPCARKVVIRNMDTVKPQKPAIANQDGEGKIARNAFPIGIVNMAGALMSLGSACVTRDMWDLIVRVKVM